MAGYVLYHGADDVTTVLYGELSPHNRGSELARLAFYENENCQKLAMELWLAVGSNCYEKVGVNCTCFCINGHDFSARTISERKLWLRAISNMKVKLQNSAPAPSKDDIGHYREAIEEELKSQKQIRNLEHSIEGRGPVDALLQKVSRRASSRPSRSASRTASRDISRCNSPPPIERRQADDVPVQDHRNANAPVAPVSPSRRPSCDPNSPGESDLVAPPSAPRAVSREPANEETGPI